MVISPHRRTILTAAGLLPFARMSWGQSPGEPETSGRIVRMQEPRNLETPIDGLLPWQTKTHQHYVRSHFAVPKLNPAEFRLTVTGHVEKPLELSLAELLAINKLKRPLTLECAGNGRVFLTPAVPGLQWGIGAVGNAVWTGVSLGAILERVKPKVGAVDVVMIGADQGTIAGPPSSPGPISFDRGISIEKAKRDECLLATEMNGEPLSTSHGAPLRAVIGGWYGMASVKWLTKIIVTDKPYQGFWQSLDYAYWKRENELRSLVPLTAMQPKAMILKPGLDAVVGLNQKITVVGKAWAGDNRVAKVEVSTDAGKTWQIATLANDEKEYCWRSWSLDWTPTIAGPVALYARCTDDKGLSQPVKRDADFRSYMIHHLVPTDVTVRG